MKSSILKKIGVLFIATLVVGLWCGSAFAPPHVETAGNCLSLPVIWSEGATKDLRGAFGTPLFAGETFTDVNGITWYLQQDENNLWQAESMIPAEPVNVTWIDWGDNLEAHPWTVRSIVRTETVLYQDISAAPMVGFEMGHLWGAGTDEMWGTNTVQYASNLATVYSGVARLTIQKLTGDADLAWDAAQSQWVGAGIEGTYYNSAVWEAEGKDGKILSTIYSGEINIPGKVIYGYNWNVRKVGNGAGIYRLTFSLDDVDTGTGCTIPCNTFFTEGVTDVLLSDSVSGGGVAVIDYANNLTYIDVEITPK